MSSSGEGGAALDEKARRVRSLLSSYYGAEDADDGSTSGSVVVDTTSLDKATFDADRYMADLLQKTRLDGLLSKHAETSQEIRSLDSDMQMLVYENYNKFISATDTIRSMKSNVEGMELKMEELLQTIEKVAASSGQVNDRLSKRRDDIENLSGVRSVLRKLQLVLDLPAKLKTCLQHDALASAVHYYLGALPVLRKYGESAAFVQVKSESEMLMQQVSARLRSELLSNDSKLSAAEAQEYVELLTNLGESTSELSDTFIASSKEQLLASLALAMDNANKRINESSSEALKEFVTELNQSFLTDFAYTVTSVSTLFPNPGAALLDLTSELFERYFKNMRTVMSAAIALATEQEHVEILVSSLSTMATDVGRMESLVPRSGLSEQASRTVADILAKYVEELFERLHSRTKSQLQRANSAVVQAPAGAPGTRLSSLLEDTTLSLLGELKEVIKGVELLLEAPGTSRLVGEVGMGELQANIQAQFQASFACIREMVLGQAEECATVTPVAVLLLARILQALEAEGVPTVMEAAAEKFPGLGSSAGAPPFVAGEVMRALRSDAEQLLQEYVLAQSASVGAHTSRLVEDQDLLESPAPIAVRDAAKEIIVHMSALSNDTSQLLPGSLKQTQPSSGAVVWSQPRASPTSGTSSSDVAKLFQQKVELFTPLSFTYASVIAAIMKRSIKDCTELVRQKTWGVHALQQMQVDTYYLRGTLPTQLAEDGAIDSLIDDLLVSIVERCLDPVPLSSDAVLGMLREL